MNPYLNPAYEWGAGQLAVGASTSTGSPDPMHPRMGFWARLFGRKSSKISDNGKFSGEAPFRIVYEARPVPTINNPLRYAYDSLALPGTAPVGRATAIRFSKMPGLLQGAQVWSLQGVLISGLPLTAGQMYGQPLYNPAVPGGFVAEPQSNLLPTRNAAL